MAKLYLISALVLLFCISGSTAKPGNGNGNGNGNGGFGNGKKPGSSLLPGECMKSSDCRAIQGAAVCVGGYWRGPWNNKKGTCACKDPCKVFKLTGGKKNVCAPKCNIAAGEVCQRAFFNKFTSTATCVLPPVVLPPTTGPVVPAPAPAVAPVPAPVVPAPAPAPVVAVPAPAPTPVVEAPVPAPSPV